MVRSGPVVLDTNVAALLVVGRAGRDLIARHKRTDTFTIADFEALEELLERVTHAVCLPHILSELSNILKAGRDQRSLDIRSCLRHYCTALEEREARSAPAAELPEFRLLDLADCRLILAAAEGCLVVSADAELVAALRSRGHPCVDFLAYARSDEV